MTLEPTFESLCFNSFFPKNYLNDSNQDPDVNFYNDICSIETSCLLPCEVNNKLKRFSSETFSILHVNIKSMTKSFETFKKHYNSLNFSFSITCLSEAWANHSKPEKNSLCQLEGYNSVNQIKKNCKGVEIAIFIQDLLLHKIREDLRINCDDIESLPIEIINNHSKNIVLNVVYRPPEGDVSVTVTFFRKILSGNIEVNKTLFLSGDFNINVLDCENNKKKVKNFINLLFQFSMIPTINKLARVTSYTATAIDNIITNSIFYNDFESAIIKTDVPDHFAIIFTIKLKTISSPKNHMDQFIYKCDSNEYSSNLFKQNLFETSWDNLKKIADPNESYHNFLKIFSSLLEKHFPSKKVKLKPKRKKALVLQMEL